LRRHRFALKQFWFCASFHFCFAPCFSSGSLLVLVYLASRLGVIGIRTLEPRCAGIRLGSRHERGAGILVPFPRGSALWGFLGSAR